MITLDSNPSDAPCCVKIINDDGRDVLVQTDWDWPSVATNFGWNIVRVQSPGLGFDAEYYRPTCFHHGTDGTIDCPDCGCKASQFIESARAWIDDNDGAQAEDPGYFNAE